MNKNLLPGTLFLIFATFGNGSPKCFQFSFWRVGSLMGWEREKETERYPRIFSFWFCTGSYLKLQIFLRLFLLPFIVPSCIDFHPSLSVLLFNILQSQSSWNGNDEDYLTNREKKNITLFSNHTVTSKKNIARLTPAYLSTNTAEWHTDDVTQRVIDTSFP